MRVLLLLVLVTISSCGTLDYESLLSIPEVQDMIKNSPEESINNIGVDTLPFVTTHIKSYQDTVRVMVYVHNIKKLLAYQFQLSYDTVSLNLIGSSVGGILGMNSIGFTQYQIYPIYTHSVLCYASSITGDSTECVSGSGLLGEALFLSNKAKVNVEVSRVYTVLIGKEDELDTLHNINYIEEYN